MTKEEAIRKLTQLKNKYLDEYVDYDNTASTFDMAIDAIKKQIPVEPKTIEGQRCCAFCGKVFKPYECYCFICGQRIKEN